MIVHVSAFLIFAICDLRFAICDLQVLISADPIALTPASLQTDVIHQGMVPLDSVLSVLSRANMGPHPLQGPPPELSIFFCSCDTCAWHDRGFLGIAFGAHFYPPQRPSRFYMSDPVSNLRDNHLTYLIEPKG